MRVVSVLVAMLLAPALLAQKVPSGSMTKAIATADSLIAAAAGVQFPGAVLVVARNGVVMHERAFGYAQLFDSAGHRLTSPPAMHVNTMFDIASVTKVMATTNAVMLLASRGQLDVDAPVHRYLPDFRGPHLDSITVRHLLTHTAGLVQWQPLYYHAASTPQTCTLIRDMPLAYGVGEGRHYSDLGFMLLGDIVEAISGERLNTFVERELYRPLGLHSTLFVPRQHGFTDFAATETGNGYEHHMVYDSTFGYRYTGDPARWNSWRGYVLRGEVNDGNSWYANGGIAGHAGLFSTAADLRVLVDLLLAGGESGGHRYLRPDVIARFLALDRYDNYLGWMRPAGLPDGSFMHNGFTGTYVLGVPRYGLSVILLTNRQQTGTNSAGYFPNVSPLQAAVAQALVNGASGDEAHLSR